jgi:hypothetical protein
MDPTLHGTANSIGPFVPAKAGIQQSYLSV